MGKILNIEYASLHATHWMYYGVVSSFASVYLLANNYSNSDIGLILAIANILAVVLQPIVADYADRQETHRVIGITQFMTIVSIVLTSVLFVISGKSLLLSVLFVMIVGWFTSIQPLINSLAFSLQESGVHINFGVARSMGSLAYALLCAVLGSIVEKCGIQAVPVAGVITLALLFLGLAMTKKHYLMAKSMHNMNEGGKLPIHESKEDTATRMEELETEAQEVEIITLKEFARRNKFFIIMTLGVAFLFYGNNVLNTFMIQVVSEIGGNEVDMGRIIGVMAALEIPTMVFFDQINKKFTCKTLLKIAAFGFFAKIALCYLAKTVTMLYLAQSMQLVAFALMLPAMVKFIDEAMTSGEAVKGQAVYTAMATVGGVVSSITGGWILDSSSAHMLLLVSTILTLVGAVIITVFVEKIKGKNR